MLNEYLFILQSMDKYGCHTSVRVYAETIEEALQELTEKDKNRLLSVQITKNPYSR